MHSHVFLLPNFCSIFFTHLPMLSEAVLERQNRNSLTAKLQRLTGSFSESFQSLSTVNYLTIIALQIVVFSSLCVAYLAYSNQYITQGYVVNKFEAERSQLVIENEMSNRLLEQAKSLSAIRDRAHAQMVYSHGHQYVESHDTTVAIALHPGAF